MRLRDRAGWRWKEITVELCVPSLCKMAPGSSCLLLPFLLPPSQFATALPQALAHKSAVVYENLQHSDVTLRPGSSLYWPQLFTWRWSREHELFMYDFQERNRTAVHLTGSELRCSISPFRPSFYTFSDTSSDFVFCYKHHTLEFSVVVPGQYWMFWSSAHAYWQDEWKETWCVIDPKEPLFPSSDAAGYFPSSLSVYTCQLPPPPQCPNLPCLQAFTW